MIQIKMIIRKLYITFSLSSSIENGWKGKAEKSWRTEVLTASTETLEDLENLAKGLNAGYSILEKSEINFNEKGEIPSTIIMVWLRDKRIVRKF